MSEADLTSDDSVLPGASLRVAREHRKLSREDVAQRIKYSLKQIEALEHDDYTSLPALISTRGMVRSYAKLVGLTPEPLIDRLNAHFTVGPPTVMVRDMAVPFPNRPTASHKTYWILSGIVVLAIGAFLIESFVFAPKRGATPVESTSPGGAPTVTTPGVQSVPLAIPQSGAPGVAETPGVSAETTAAAAPAGSVAAPPPAPAAGAKRIALEFTRDSWVDVRDMNGTVVHNQLHRAGTSVVVDHTVPVRVVIGAAAGVRMTYNGKEYDLGTSTQVDVARFTLN
jgi:cytoskeleton protein RodZ